MVDASAGAPRVDSGVPRNFTTSRARNSQSFETLDAKHESISRLYC